MKKILGLDIGTNSIGWSVVGHDAAERKGEILGLGSRIIPMTQDVLDKFSGGAPTATETAERTRYRSVRRLFQRKNLRRERLHRVLHVLDYLPKDYSNGIDFEKRLGQFLPNKEPKLAYDQGNNFIFQNSFNEMLADFKHHQPSLLVNKHGKPALVPYDWTIYYLRKKALTKKVTKEELSWLLLHFNQKRGYYQLREEEEVIDSNKIEDYHALKVVEVVDTGDKKGNDQKWYNVILENGWIYKRASKFPLFDWVNTTKEFVVTTEKDKDGALKMNKEGEVKRSFRAPKEDDWTLVKRKTELELENSGKSVGAFIYDTLLSNPDQKIIGKLIRTIERRYYKAELNKILEVQCALHEELQSEENLSACLNELYKHNEGHKNSISNRGFIHLFLNDIIFYQRPLKSKKSDIGECRYEKRSFVGKDEKRHIVGVKCIPKSHPIFQEFRLWEWLQNLRIFEREVRIDGKLVQDVDVTASIISNTSKREALFKYLQERKEIDQKALFKELKLKSQTHRWNFPEDKTYPCSETRTGFLARLEKSEVDPAFLTNEMELKLWHILYSVTDKIELNKTFKNFAERHDLPRAFADQFSNYPPFKAEYGSYSLKSIGKILPLLRSGSFWNKKAIHADVAQRIQLLIDGEFDEDMDDKVREKTRHLNAVEDFSGLPLWLTCYIIYGRHSENESSTQWKSPQAIADFLKGFKQHSLRNPIVEGVITETLRTVKEIWENYGDGKPDFFDAVHIELGREMKQPKAARDRLSKINKQNEDTNLRIQHLLLEFSRDGQIRNVRPHSPSQQEILKIFEDGIISAESALPDDIAKISKSALPTRAEVVKYKAWLEQRYRSPYTNQIIPLSRLFTNDYEIEHVIPQSRYFDNSFSNKVICESAVNKLKNNQLGYEFIKNHGGEKVDLGNGQYTEILKTEAYETFVKTNYGSSSKMKKLMMDEIPTKFIERQLNDTRYITKYVMALLSNLVREEGETDYKAKRLVVCTGGVTSRLKHDWGLNHIWNEIISPRFVRLNEMKNTNDYGSINQNTGKFLPQVPLEEARGFSKKRIDHRHHALDALVVACATANHVNYLNNESHLAKGKNKEEKLSVRHDLKNKLCYKSKVGNNGNYNWVVKKSWETLTQDAREALLQIVPSFKQNTRVINKTMNKADRWVQKSDDSFVKEKVKQTGENWAVRKPLHKETVYGKVQIKVNRGKVVTINKALENPELILETSIRRMVLRKVKELHDYDALKAYFKDHQIELNHVRVSKIGVYELLEGTASRVALDSSFNKAKIEKSVTDSGIKKILINHLEQSKYMIKAKYSPDMAFSPEGIEEMNQNLTSLNGGKPHHPIYKVRVFEEGNRFAVGQTGNKSKKYVEAAKGTNLFYAVYEDENEKRNFESVPLNEVVAHQKLQAEQPNQVNTPIAVNNEKGRFLFSLSPNDLVYVPTRDEMEQPEVVDIRRLTSDQMNRVYKMVSCTGNQAFFIQANIATSILNKVEFSALNKMERSVTAEEEMIKDVCWKLVLNRLGQIKRILR
jgi:CRISPR-associated endonuclease Csn1